MFVLFNLFLQVNFLSSECGFKRMIILNAWGFVLYKGGSVLQNAIVEDVCCRPTYGYLDCVLMGKIVLLLNGEWYIIIRLLHFKKIVKLVQTETLQQQEVVSLCFLIMFMFVYMFICIILGG